VGEIQVAQVQEQFSIATIQGGARLEARDRVKSLASPTPIEFGAMVDELASKPRAARR
jgi:hypothetical protein